MVLPEEKLEKMGGHRIRFGVFVVLFGVTLILYWMNAAAGSLKIWDEGLTALRAFEMLQSDSFPTTIMLGQPDFNKPPLYYLFAAQIMDWFGASILSVRIPSICMALITHTLVFLFVRRRVSSFPLQLLSITLLLLNAHWMDHVRVGLLESGVALGMVAAVYVTDSRNIPLFVRIGLAGIALAFGALMKHPGALLACFPVGYLLYREAPERWLRYTACVFCIAVSGYLGWVVHQFITWGEQFIDYYFTYNMYQRFGQGIEGHETSLLYYLDRLFVKAPVTGALLFITGGYAAWAGVKERRFSLHSILLLTFIVPFIIMHFFMSKRETYLISMYPFVVMAVPVVLSTWKKCTKPLAYGVGVIVAVQITLFIPRFDSTPEYSPLEKEAIFAALDRAGGRPVGVTGMPFFLAKYYGIIRAQTIVPGGLCKSQRAAEAGGGTETVLCGARVQQQNAAPPQGMIRSFSNKQFAVYLPAGTTQ